MKILRLLALGSALTLGVACGHEHDEVVCPEGAPVIESLALSPTTVAPGDEIAGTVVVQNFELSGEADHQHAQGLDRWPQDTGDHGTSECAGGHLHVYLDDVMTNPLAMPVTGEFTFTIPTGTAAGAHTILGRLHNRDHTIVEPQVIEEVDITVE